jgi:hypothetical protein
MRYEGPEVCHNGLCDRPCGLHRSEMACESAERQEGQLNGVAFLIPIVLLGWQKREVEDDARGLKGLSSDAIGNCTRELRVKMLFKRQSRAA